MECTFLMVNDNQANTAIDFFKSIGVDGYKVDDLHNISSRPIVDIEFHEIPQVIDTYTIDNELSIWNMNALGITFYMPIPPCSFISTERGNHDGFVFCPMSNIKAINTLGELRIGWKEADE